MSDPSASRRSSRIGSRAKYVGARRFRRVRRSASPQGSLIEYQVSPDAVSFDEVLRNTDTARLPQQTDMSPLADGAFPCFEDALNCKNGYH